MTTAGNSVSQQIAAAAPESAHVIKAFHSIFGGVSAQDKPVDVVFAGDNAEAKAHFADSPKLRWALAAVGLVAGAVVMLLR